MNNTEAYYSIFESLQNDLESGLINDSTAEFINNVAYETFEGDLEVDNDAMDILESYIESMGIDNSDEESSKDIYERAEELADDIFEAYDDGEISIQEMNVLIESVENALDNLD